MTTQNQNQELSETAKSKLESNTELWRAESKYIKLEQDETMVLQFDPEKIRHVERKFGSRISYSVIDPNYSDKGEKKFEASKLTSKKASIFFIIWRALVLDVAYTKTRYRLTRRMVSHFTTSIISLIGGQVLT
jgi:hypothetical protein